MPGDALLDNQQDVAGGEMEPVASPQLSYAQSSALGKAQIVAENILCHCPGAALAS